MSGDCLNLIFSILYSTLKMQEINVPVFAGHGTTALNSSATRERALQDASSSLGSLLLSSCHRALLSELSSLSPAELSSIGLSADGFETPQSLLQIPSEKDLFNPIISGISLFLIQTLRYLSFVEANSSSTDSFASVLEDNKVHGAGILGFSSGILPACVVSASNSSVQYISNTVEAFRLVFWIGVRVQQYRESTLRALDALETDVERPWSLVFIGLSNVEIEVAIAQFFKDEQPTLYVTAITDAKNITVSGRPDILATFAATLSGKASVHKTTVDTLYHSSEHVRGARGEVLTDVVRRKIRFPSFSDIEVPIRSTFTGALLSPESSGSLVTSVVDMILTQPVNWGRVVEALVDSVPEGKTIRLVNVGPGVGIVKSMERSFSAATVSSLDLTASSSIPTSLPPPKYTQEPIAIVGMAVNMPGAPSTDDLWKVLETGLNTISEIPEDRFNISDYNDPKNPIKGRSMKAHTGNFIDQPGAFDNKFFKISPREAKSLDPQQRVLLHTAYEALENSGYVPNSTPSFAPETFGCYVGVATGDYVQNLRDDIDVYYSTGTLRAFLSGRISYALQLSGPSIVLDTACSGSIVAIYQACRSLMNRDCNAALAGGVNVVTSPDMFLGLDRGHFLSPTGQCKPFDSSADGYSRSEGCGIFVLKRLSDAVAEKDNIMGVIRGVEVNQSGLAHSITHPHAPTQAHLFKQLLERTGVEASAINVVEAHGTGTQAGDPNELESIRSIFAAQRATNNPLHITSIKANIGHLEAASGAAGLAKLVLMLKHRTIPRLISLKNLNPKIAPLESDNTIIDTVQTSWDVTSGKASRMALLNNFGAAGSNGALLLEEYLIPNSKAAVTSSPQAYVFGLSGKTEEAVIELRSRYLEWLKTSEGQAASLEDICYTSTARRQKFSYRLAVSASSKEDLVEKLLNASISDDSQGRSKVAFVFSGQGSQYIGMGASLYHTTPVFKSAIDECHSLLQQMGFAGVLQVILGSGDSTGLGQLEELQINQAAIFSLEYALSKLWLSWGVVPAVVVGHSLGEYAAQVVAGVLTLKGALTIVARRASFMAKNCLIETTGMMAVNLAPAKVAEIVASFEGASVACYNSPSDCVVSGPIEQLRSLKAHLDAEVKCKNTLLSVPFGYHSSAMHPVIDDLVAVAGRVKIQAPTIPIISNVTGEVIQPGDNTVFNPQYYARHCAEPVLFEKGLESLAAIEDLASDIGTWIEVGPHTTTLPMLKAHSIVSKSSDIMLLPSIRKKSDPWTTLSSTLAQLYRSNISISWRSTFVSSPRCLTLPSYPFTKSSFWVDFREGQQVSIANTTPSALPSVQNLVSESTMLHTWQQYPSSENGHVTIFETPISQLAKFIEGHSVGDHPLCPASVYHELALAGVHAAKTHLGLAFEESYAELRDVDYSKPLVYSPTTERLVKTSISLNPDGSGTFTVSSRLSASEELAVHCFGNVRFQEKSHAKTKFSRMLPSITRSISSVLSAKGSETFSTRTAYEVIFPRVVDYSKDYHTMKTLTVDPNGSEAYSVIQLPKDRHTGKFIVHPVFMDTMLHVAGFVANMQGGVNDAFICSKVATVKVVPGLIDDNASYGVFIRNSWVEAEGLIISDAVAIELGGSGHVVAQLKGMQFRKLRLNSLRRALSMASGSTVAATKPKPVVQPARSVSFSPLPKSSRASSTVGSSSFDVRAEVLRIIAETCDVNISSLDVNENLETYGIDSLMSIEIFGKFQALCSPSELDDQLLATCHNIADIIDQLSSQLGGPSSDSDSGSGSQSGSQSPPTTLVMSGQASVASGNDQDPDVKPLLASVLGVGGKDMGDNVDLDSLGLDSLTSIEAHQMLQETYSLQLPTDLFVKCTTAKAVQDFITFRLRERAQTAAKKVAAEVKLPSIEKIKYATQEKYNPISAVLQLDTIPISIQTSTSGRPPLCLIHDGSGLVNYIKRLSPIGRPLWGIHNPHFITSQPWESVVAMASEYAEYAIKTTSGPLILGGWSFGGVVAFEAACQLIRKGINVRGVLLIDSPSPVKHVPLSDALLDAVAGTQGNNSQVSQLVKKQFQMNSRMLGRYDPVKGKYPLLVMLRSREGFNPPGVPDVPIWLADRSDPRQAVSGWETVVGCQIKSIDIPGNHFQPFHPSNLEEMTLRIAEGCQYIEEFST
ncbi:hypothetical protein BDQ12DRAFT_735983 [Crucibulum laeve]|uniref:Polyketide synthase n=1 Tax=Crucibulum laeve TaxID=68775 RepID=A0A5C3LY33_9AGAR|nr:hypothetical protein BDQ12DRAFT_735983 [Crucibulum laeve]